MKLDFRTHKWLYVAAAALMVLFGLIFLFLPGKNIGAFTAMMCILLLIVGAAKIVFHFWMQGSLDRFGWRLLDGVFEVIIALLLMFSPAASLLVAGTLVGVWALFNSVNIIFASLTLRGQGGKNWWIFLIAGVLTAFFAMLMLFYPISTAMVATAAAGLYLIIYGVTLFLHTVFA